jgi:hypothetical protein
MTLERRTTFIRGVFIHNERAAELIAVLPVSGFPGKHCVAVFFADNCIRKRKQEPFQ